MRFDRLAALALTTSLATASTLQAEGYRTPPPELAALVDAPLPPATLLAPGGARLALLDPPPNPPVAELAQTERRLAGLRFNPVRGERTRAAWYLRLRILDVATGAEKPVTGFPEDGRLTWPLWSSRGDAIAVAVSQESGVTLWVADAKSGTARQVSPLRLNAIAPTRPYSYRSNGEGFLLRTIPEGRGPEPAMDAAPDGPVIQESGGGKKAPARTYQDLLKSAHDESLLEYHARAQLVSVMADGLARPIGAPGLISSATSSPDGAYLLVQTVHRPFSYLVPMSRFPSRSEVLSLPEGRPVAVVADLPLAEDVPSDFDAQRRGRRQVGWRQDAPSTLHIVEAEDDGDPRKPADFRDRVSLLSAPFTGQPTTLVRLSTRFQEIAYGDDGLALVTESWWKTRRTKTWRVAPGRPAEKARLLFDRSTEDRYADPGDPIMERTASGAVVLKKSPDGRGIYLLGAGASAEGDRPFVDLFPVDGGKPTRLFRSEAPRYEVPVDLLEGGKLLVRRESPSEPPDLYVKDLAGKGLRRLTTTAHPVPALQSVKKEILKYTRKDGVALTATLYTPPGWDPSKGPLPVLMWAYPQEFKSASAAGQMQDSPYRFVRPSVGGPLPFLARGWAVLDDPSFPIVGEGKAEPNDTYVEQLVSSAEAAVEEMVKRGVGDRDRMAIGGHSYGAFTTANALAHTNLFRAGIARSGAYNRTLTPFGFQSEERTFWEAPDTYMKVSPFTQAAKVDEPILMIHGQDDNNAGTFPIQSERFFAALKGLGKNARLVMLPYESHGYRGRESVLHTLWEMDTWLETYVKNAPPRNLPAAPPRS